MACLISFIAIHPIHKITPLIGSSLSNVNSTSMYRVVRYILRLNKGKDSITIFRAVSVYALIIYCLGNHNTCIIWNSCSKNILYTMYHNNLNIFSIHVLNNSITLYVEVNIQPTRHYNFLIFVIE